MSSATSAASRERVLTDALRRLSSGQKLSPEEWRDFVNAQNEGLTTGPEVGQRVPEFELPDQNGHKRTRADLSGRNGLLLAFVRSADW